jgi:protein subunit release factor B
MSRERVLRITIKDCETQTFRAGGKGGQNQNKRDTGVRIIHHPSGARGESREGRGQLENKKLAFRRMAESVAFRIWVAEMHMKLPPIEDVVDEMMQPENLKVEVRQASKWVEDE